ncbi:hypothetical protein GXP67_10835 [Rhodocytophaga rosea]|uniref:Translocation and assembly module TamB C-terminal domain-containing protein n=1 Tax=Rhodocytophaga rosea TaxID=2704465 RepID=A0A6C0GHD0_9BACT|nr:translocation/assembly module TamB domain-containing protein [Rhodocytophaga rosea]QHT67110.1 hypothetical protein GXP67_10835 [Rhodocytophaga rosea]
MFAAVWGALQIPQVQTAVVKKVTQSLSKKLNTTLSIKRVDIDFFKTVVLEGIYLEDQKKDTLLFAQELKVNLGILSLLNKTVHVNLIGLDNAVVNLTRAENDSTFNFAFIPEAFASSDTTAKDTTASAWDFDLSEVNLQKVRFTMADDYQGNDLNMALNSFVVDVQTLGLSDKYPKINSINIDGLQMAFSQPQPEADTLAQAAAEVTKLDTLASSVAKAIDTDSLPQQAGTQVKDSVETPFNDSGYRLTIKDIDIKNTNLKYDVKGAHVAAKGMDFGHIDVRGLLLAITGIEIGPNNFALQVENFAFREKSGFDLKQLALDFKADMPAVQIDLQKLQTAHSLLDDGILINIASITDAANLVKQLEIYAKFKQDSLGIEDAQYFTTALDTFPALQAQHLFLDGNMHLDGQNAEMERLKLSINNANYLLLNGNASNIYNLADMQVNLDISPLHTSSTFIQSFLPKGTLPPQFNEMGNIVLRANLNGRLSGIKGDINLQTAAGSANMNFTGSTDTSFTRNQANARLSVRELNLEKILGKESKMGKVTLTAQINGSRNGDNIAVKNALVNLASLRYNQYTYRNIKLTGDYINELATAVLESDDKNLQATLKASANMQTKQPGFHLLADIREVNLRELNFTTDTLTIRSGIFADMRGTVPDEMTGGLTLSNLVVQQSTRALTMDSLIVALDKNDDFRTVSIRSDVLSAKAQGNFTFEELPQAINLFIKEYLTTYPVSNQALKNDQSVKFEMAVKANPQIIEGMVEGLDIPQDITFTGNFSSATNQLNLQGNAPQINFGEQGVSDFKLDVNTNGDKLSFGAQAAQVKVSDSLVVPLPRITSTIDEDNLKFNIRFAAEEAISRLNLNGRFMIKKDTFIVNFDPSDIYVKNKHWQLADNSKIVYAPKYLFADNFMLNHNDQVIAIYSRDIGNAPKPLHVSLSNIDIGEILELVGQQALGLSGKIFGETEIQDLFEAPTIEALVKVDTLKVNESAIGHIRLEADRNTEGGISLQANIESQANDINAAGSYFPAKETDNLSLDVKINKITLEQFRTFVSKHVTEMSGNLTADLKVRGSISEPAVTGDLVFGKTLIRPALLGVPFTINDQKISFRDKTVVLEKFTFADEDKRTAVLDGNLDYRDMENIRMNMSFKTDRFQFLNTRTGESFYGKAFASVNIRMQGPVSNLEMTGNVRTLEDTQVFLIAYDKGAAEVERAEYITFINPNAPASENDAENAEEEEEASISGFVMNLRATVTSETEVNILLNDQSKDNIRALGDGDFDLRMTPQGDFLINGVYTINDGSYLLDLMGAVKKKFDIRKGSTITLNGPPTDAELDITAVYEVETSLADIGVETESKRVPVWAVTKISGNLEGLEVKFDIEIPNTGDNNYALNDRLASIRADESELNKQVFSLIALNKFLPENNNLFGGSGGGGGTTSTVNAQVDQGISGLLSQQLNNLAQDYLGVQVSVNVESREGTSSYTDKNVGVNVSKQLFDERLSVSVGGNVGVGGAASASNNARNIIGDFTVEYRLLPSGNLNLKFFRKNEQNILISSTRQQERIGFSILHRKNFNRWKYLFISRKRARERENLKLETSSETKELD